MLINLGFAGITPDLMELFKAYETGNISTDYFVEKAKNWVPEANSEQLRNAWNAILLDFPEYRLEFIEGMSKSSKYRLFLLSNTNELHLNRVKEDLGRSRYERFTNSFENCYFSHEVHMRKPDPAIFQHILSNHDLNPMETLFIDDTLEHIDTARRLGIKTWHIQVGKEDVVELNQKLAHD